MGLFKNLKDGLVKWFDFQPTPVDPSDPWQGEPLPDYMIRDNEIRAAALAKAQARLVPPPEYVETIQERKQDDELSWPNTHEAIDCPLTDPVADHKRALELARDNHLKRAQELDDQLYTLTGAPDPEVGEALSEQELADLFAAVFAGDDVIYYPYPPDDYHPPYTYGNKEGRTGMYADVILDPPQKAPRKRSKAKAKKPLPASPKTRKPLKSTPVKPKKGQRVYDKIAKIPLKKENSNVKAKGKK